MLQSLFFSFHVPKSLFTAYFGDRGTNVIFTIAVIYVYVILFKNKLTNDNLTQEKSILIEII